MPHLLLNRRALTLIEVVASTMIVGMMSVAALNTLGAATRSADSIANRAVALGLANDLMSEILQKPYTDPNGTTTFGPDSGETTRAAFDDVDDYNGWNKSPPEYLDGTTMTDRADFRRRVAVAYVMPVMPTQTSNTDLGAKRITVTVEYKTAVLAEQIAVRTNLDE